MPRAITRNPDSDSAHALKAQGVEVVKGNLWDKGSIREAISGSEVVFAIRVVDTSCSVPLISHLRAGDELLGS